MTATKFDAAALLKAMIVEQARRTLPIDSAGATDDEIWDTVRNQPADVDFVLIVTASVGAAIYELGNRVAELETQARRSAPFQSLSHSCGGEL
jgi:hypothetical protein